MLSDANGTKCTTSACAPLGWHCSHRPKRPTPGTAQTEWYRELFVPCGDVYTLTPAATNQRDAGTCQHADHAVIPTGRWTDRERTSNGVQRQASKRRRRGAPSGL